jgi:ribosomal protein S6--L-glutamate ligase
MSIEDVRIRETGAWVKPVPVLSSTMVSVPWLVLFHPWSVGPVHSSFCGVVVVVGMDEMEAGTATQKGLRIALGKRIRPGGEWACVGVKPNWRDFSPDARKAIEEATELFYPSPLYEDVFECLGKRTYPKNYYGFMGNKIRQSNLFQFLGIPHPRTRLYQGRNVPGKIVEDFSFPFVAKVPLGSSMGEGVFLIQNPSELHDYLEANQPAYIQEYLPIERDLRAVVIRGQVVHAYWRTARPGEFRNNVSRGGDISYEDIPEDALAFAASVAERCRFDEVGLDVCSVNGDYYVLEANMVFGLEGFTRIGLDLQDIFLSLQRRGIL